jgi:membrane fusion protein (multidrug efflux system)
MFATVSMVESIHPQVLTLPSEVLLKDADGAYVFILQGSTAKRVRIQTGAEVDSRTEILSGLAGNETILTTGQQFVKDGGAVMVQR